jgi:PAS domain S-box-containing protein
VRGMARDVTERVIAETALRVAEANYRSILENAPVGFFQTTQQGRYLAVNPMMAHINGYASPEEMIESVTDIGSQLYADLADRVEFVRQVEEYGEVHEFVNQIRRKDGGIIWVSTNTRVVKDTQGKTLCYEGFLTDITEHKRAEEAVLESELKFRTIFERTLDGILIADMKKRRFFMSNRAISQMLGYTNEELSGLGVDDIHPLEILPYVLEQFNRLALGEIEMVEDLLVKRKDGSVFHANVKATPVTLYGQTYIMGVFHDITKRKKAEAQIQLQSSALIAAANAILITNCDGNIQWVNPAWMEMTGYTLEEVISQNPRLLKSGVQDEAFYKNLWDTILAGKVWRSELVNKRKDGSLYTEEETITPLLGADGVITHFIAIKQDISERKRAEDEIKKQLDELQRWYGATMERENRVLDLKREVNELLVKSGQPPRYESAM